MNHSPTDSIIDKVENRKSPTASWIDYGILIAVLLVCGVTLSRNMADPDLWGHVQYGRDALQAGLPTTTSYSYIAQGYPWVNHEIVSEYLLALGADSVGPVGLMILKTLLGVLAVAVIVYFAVRNGVSLFSATLVALMVGLALADHWSCRPQLFSYLSTVAMFALLTWCFEGWEGPWRFFTWPLKNAADYPPINFSRPRMKFLWLMPVLMVAWTNAHGGFLAGFCIFTAYLGLRGIEAVIAHGWQARGICTRFLMMITATGLATFLNPYGPNFHFWLFDDLKVPRPEILEWRAPDFTDPMTIPYALLVLLWGATLIFSRRNRDFTHTVIAGLLVWQSMEHSRHGAFFAIACGFWLPIHLESILQRMSVGKQDAGNSPAMSPIFSKALAGGLAVTYLLLGYFVCERVSEIAVPRNQYPVSAMDYLGRNKFTGKLMCTFNWAQYALAGVGPQEPNGEGLLVHVDGRCRTSYSQEMLDAHFDFILGDVGPDIRYRDPKSGPYDPTRILRDGNPDLVLLCRTQCNSVATMQANQDEWTLLYQDSLAQVWGRSRKYDDVTSADYVPPSKRLITEEKQTGSVMWPAFTWREKTLLEKEALVNAPTKPNVTTN